MQTHTIVSTLQNHKGQHVRATWKRQLKTLKGVVHTVEKQTSAWVRAGIDYANLSKVKEGIETGERGEVQPLKFGFWVQFPFIIRHTPKGSESPVDYVRLYPATFANLKTPAVEYFIDGKPATAEDVRPLCLASEFREREDELLCFTLKAESVLSIE